MQADIYGLYIHGRETKYVVSIICVYVIRKCACPNCTEVWKVDRVISIL